MNVWMKPPAMCEPGPEMDAAMNLDLTRGDRNMCFAQKKRKSPTENDVYVCVCLFIYARLNRK